MNHEKLDIELDRQIIDQILSGYPDVMIIATFWRLHQIVRDQNNLSLIELYSSLQKQNISEISGEMLRSTFEKYSSSNIPITDRSIELFVKTGLFHCGEKLILNDKEPVAINQMIATDFRLALTDKNKFKLQRGFKSIIVGELRTVELSISAIQFFISWIFRLSEPIHIKTLKKRLDGLLSFMCEYDMQTTHRILRRGTDGSLEKIKVAEYSYCMDEEVFEVLEGIDNFDFIIEYLIWYNQTKSYVEEDLIEIRGRLKQISPQLVNRSIKDAVFNLIKNILILPKNVTHNNITPEKIDILAFKHLPGGRPMKDYLIGVKASSNQVPSIFTRFIDKIPIKSPDDTFTIETEKWLACISQMYGALFAGELLSSSMTDLIFSKSKKGVSYGYLQDLLLNQDSYNQLLVTREKLDKIRTNLILSALNSYQTRNIDDINANFISMILK